MRIAIVHYAAPPVIGGVERVIEQQARVLVAHGHEVVVVCGNAGARVEGAEMCIIPWLQAGADGVAMKQGQQKCPLTEVIEPCETVIIHNMLTMPFNWQASLDLASLTRSRGATHFVNWVHDVDVPPEEFGRLNARVTHVAVSKLRQQEFCRRMGFSLERCRVIPNGVDAAATLGLTPNVAAFAERHRLFHRDLVLLHPARVLARKNIELGIEVTAALRRLGRNVIYVVTGAPDPHRKESAAYAAAIRAQVMKHDLEENVLFASQSFRVENEDVGAFYRLADALFFPSVSEGFGLPLLEAVLHRLPVFCSDIAVHREVACPGAVFFALDENPETLARTITQRMEEDVPGMLRRNMLRTLVWKYIHEECLEPLLKGR